MFIHCAQYGIICQFRIGDLKGVEKLFGSSYTCPSGVGWVENK